MHKFREEADFQAFEPVMVEAHLRQPIRSRSYCIQPWPVGSRERCFDHEGIRPSAGDRRERTTIRRTEVGAGNGTRSRVGTHRSSGRPPTESERIDDRCDWLTMGTPSSGLIRTLGQTNRDLVSVPCFRPMRTPSSGLIRTLGQTNRAPVSVQWSDSYTGQTNRAPVSVLCGLRPVV
jgi:hypothetical protein